jgi:ABC-2 type transport system ATP-binding protein
MEDRKNGSVVEVRDLSKSYGPVRALDRVSFTVSDGEIVGFLGPNGAGKTTTLRILAGFLPGDSGLVRVAGHDVAREPLAVRQAIGYLPEGVPLYGDLRVVEYLRFRARLKGIPPWRCRGEIDRCLEVAGVSDVRRRIIGTLSRGYRQRVGLADALLGEPRVLILDEPTVGLDPEQVRQFRAVLRAVGRERTVILSTHILREVELVCSHVVIIHRGRIAARDRADSLGSLLLGRTCVVAEIAGPSPGVLDALRGLSGVTRVSVEDAAGGGNVNDEGAVRDGAEAGAEEPAAPASAAPGVPFHRYRMWSTGGRDLREEVFALAARRGLRLRRLDHETLSLEDVFLSIVGGGE